MTPLGTSFDDRDFDVAIIGAGINGAAAARELARAGYSVLLCDRDDFAAGASSRSSRILHCGLRYFETEHPLRNFALHPRRFAQAMVMARDAMQARREIALTAPKGVQAFTMCFPVYPESPIRGWHLSLGLRLLERLAPRDPPLERRRIHGDIAAHLPFAADLRDFGRLQSVATYREYLLDWPERFCVDAALEAEAAGAVVRNFCPARLQTRGADGRWRLEINPPEGTMTVRARLVLNMAGTEIDRVNATAHGPERRRRLVRGTKGAHIVVRLPQTYQGYGIATLNRRGMPFYCLPSHEEFFFFGPTETPFEGEARGVAAEDADIDFLLGEANHLLPRLGLTRADVAFTWAGVRPLTWDENQPGGRRVREIHDLAQDGLPRVLAMTAGPVMSHRSAARALRGRVEAALGPPPPRHDGATTWQVSEAPLRRTRVDIAPEARRAAIRRAVESQHARDLTGILYTRNALGWRGHLSFEDVREAARGVADLLGWSEEEIERRTEDFLHYQRTVFRDGGSAASPPETKPINGDMPA